MIYFEVDADVEASIATWSSHGGIAGHHSEKKFDLILGYLHYYFILFFNNNENKKIKK